jgi:hypothetical protein
VQIGTDLSYAERMLRYMRLCCCVGFFCSCCTEPERNKKDAKWREQADRERRRREQQGRQQGGAGGQQRQKGNMPQQPGQPTYAGVNTQGLDEDAREVRWGKDGSIIQVIAQNGMDL